MKLARIILVFFGIFLLISLSDFIYIYKNEPYHFGKIFLYLALSETKKGNLDMAMKNLDKAAHFHLKQNQKQYNDRNIETKYQFRTSCHPEEWNDEGSLNLFQNSHSREILPPTLRRGQNDNCEIRAKVENNLARLNEETQKKILQYLLKNFSSAINKNKTPNISNIYYNLGLITYDNNFQQEANSLFLAAISLDPELGHLYLELANSYFKGGNYEKGVEILKFCQQFKYPKKQCQQYLKENVQANSFETVGIYKDEIYKFQSQYY